MVWASSCVGTVPPWAAASADAIRAALLPSPLPLELLVSHEREDAVGLLGETDGPEAREDRHEVHRHDERVDRAPGKDVGRQPREERGAAGEGEAGEERASRPPNAEQHGDREPVEADDRVARCCCLT